MTQIVKCPFCSEAIAATAIKCKHCHEYLGGDGQCKKTRVFWQFFPTTVSILGKALVPLAIIVIAFAYKPTIESVIRRATYAEFMGSKIVFENTRFFVGSLSPVELFYLIGSAKNYDQKSGGWNLDSLEKDGRISVIYALKDKGLVEFRISDMPGVAEKMGYGKRGITTWPTEKGKDFLIELGLEFDGSKFKLAP